MTDPIADMIIRIKNALLARHTQVVIPHSKLKEAIAHILMREGYIQSVEIKPLTPQAEIVVQLKYVGKQPAVTDVRRVSTPGRRMYSAARRVPRSLGGYGITIVSTNKGVMTDSEAKKLNVGGEVLCQIW